MARPRLHPGRLGGHGLLFGLAGAAVHAAALAGTLKDQAGAWWADSVLGLRKGLVVAQVSLSLLLLIGAGLFVQSLSNLKDLEPGFPHREPGTFAVDPTLNGASRPQPASSTGSSSTGWQRMPGAVVGRARSDARAGRQRMGQHLTVEGYTARQGEWVDPHMQFFTPGFFDTLGIPILVGRDSRCATTDANAQSRHREREVRADVFRNRQPDRPATSEWAATPGRSWISKSWAWWATPSTRTCATRCPYELYRPYTRWNS